MTWRVLNSPPQVLNYLRQWLLSDIVSVAFNLFHIHHNTSRLHDEVLIARLGLLPVKADPLILEDFEGGSIQNCEPLSCVQFELNVENLTDKRMNVMSSELKWVPFGDQAEIFQEPPRISEDDILLARLTPGQAIHVTCYAVKGTAEQHAKWNAANAFYRPVPVSITQGTQPEITTDGCVRCEDLSPEIVSQPRFNCTYFTIELTSGLSFSDITDQLITRFTWPSKFQPINTVEAPPIAYI